LDDRVDTLGVLEIERVGRLEETRILVLDFHLRRTAGTTLRLCRAFFALAVVSERREIFANWFECVIGEQ
ncbi:MAG TPA: hypothetical protein VLV86_10840, partial [Vicinamibacterales bacterium]|nr:hypothetical protein [Vicinamibacterales bacterium]